MKTPRSLLPITLALTAAIVASPACSKKKEEQPAPPQAATPSTPVYKAVAEVPETERKAMDAFARELEKNLKSGNAAAVKPAFNISGIIANVVAGVNASSGQLDEFRTGMNQGLRQNLDFILKIWMEQEVTYKHLVVHEGRLKPRFRLASDNSGITLLDFTVETGSDGRLGITDFYNQALGSGMVEQSRQAALPVLAELDKSFLERMLGGKSSTALKDIEAYGTMADQFRKKDLSGAVATYRGMAPEMRRNLAANAMYLAALQQSGDDEGYKTALKEAAQVHKSANFQFMLVDLYFLEKNYDKAVECLDVFMAAVEKDAALLSLKGLLLMTKGDHPGAVAAIREALALEPQSIYVHTKGLDVFLQAGAFDDTAASMKHLESTGKFNFKQALSDPVWEGFLKSPASAPWR